MYSKGTARTLMLEGKMLHYKWFRVMNVGERLGEGITTFRINSRRNTSLKSLVAGFKC